MELYHQLSQRRFHTREMPGLESDFGRPCMEKYVYQRCSDLTERNDLEEAQPSEVPEFNGG